MPDDIEIKFLEGSFVVYVSKHKIFTAATGQKGNKLYIVFWAILKDYETEYKIPNITDVKSSPCRIYKGRDKPATAGFPDRFDICKLNKEIYEKRKISIQNILQKAYDNTKNHWDKRLIIDVRSGTIKSALNNLENDIEKTEEYAFKFLREDYTYDV